MKSLTDLARMFSASVNELYPYQDRINANIVTQIVGFVGIDYSSELAYEEPVNIINYDFKKGQED